MRTLRLRKDYMNCSELHSNRVNINSNTESKAWSLNYFIHSRKTGLFLGHSKRLMVKSWLILFSSNFSSIQLAHWYWKTFKVSILPSGSSINSLRFSIIRLRFHRASSTPCMQESNWIYYSQNLLWAYMGIHTHIHISLYKCICWLYFLCLNHIMLSAKLLAIFQASIRLNSPFSKKPSLNPIIRYYLILTPIDLNITLLYLMGICKKVL